MSAGPLTSREAATPVRTALIVAGVIGLHLS